MAAIWSTVIDARPVARATAARPNVYGRVARRGEIRLGVLLRRVEQVMAEGLDRRLVHPIIGRPLTVQRLGAQQRDRTSPRTRYGSGSRRARRTVAARSPYPRSGPTRAFVAQRARSPTLRGQRPPVGRHCIQQLQQLQSRPGFVSELDRNTNTVRRRWNAGCPGHRCSDVRRSADVSETTIVVRCPDCRTGRVSASSVTVRWCLDVNDWSYRAPAPAATRLRREHPRRPRPPCPRRRRPARDVDPSAELTERPPAGRTIDAVDILELRLALHEPEWFDKLRDMTFPEDRKG